ncbi:hypothetical protein BC940DRAFT_290198 [Gongronella butleri]|nr:hypothetical protein BC940DRAFT_290198 [Gongronella butleri]
MTTVKSSAKEPNTFTRREREMGLHLLSLPESPVHVRSAPVPEEKRHLYPKLVASNWICYITTDSVILGRASVDPKAKDKVGVDFHSDMRISRRHAAIKHNKRKNHWELHVYGRNGVKVNHTFHKATSRVVLSTMSYLNIGDNECIFVLPESTGKPEKMPSVHAGSVASTSTNVISRTEAQQPNQQLLDAILHVFQAKRVAYLPTRAILDSILEANRDQSNQEQFTMDAVLRALVMDEMYRVTPTSMNMKPSQAGDVQWLRPSHLSPIPVPEPAPDARKEPQRPSGQISDDEFDFMDDVDDRGSMGSWHSTPRESGVAMYVPSTDPAANHGSLSMAATVATISPAERTLSTLSGGSSHTERATATTATTDIDVHAYHAPHWRGAAWSRGQSLMAMYESALSLPSHDAARHDSSSDSHDGHHSISDPADLWRTWRRTNIARKYHQQQQTPS